MKEELLGSSPFDSSSTIPLPDFSDSVDAQIGEESGLDSMESDIKFWIDSRNIDATNNATLSDGDLLTEWIDLSGNANNGVNNGDVTFQEGDVNGQVYFVSNNGHIQKPNFTADLTEAEVFYVLKLPSRGNQSGFHTWGGPDMAVCHI